MSNVWRVQCPTRCSTAKFGPPDVLQWVEADPLVPARDQLVVETRAIEVKPAEVTALAVGDESESRVAVGKIVLIP